jgi:hypothetical protein
MTATIRSYLVKYIVKRRTIALIGVVGWTSALLIGWLILFHEIHGWLVSNRWIDRSVIVLGIVTTAASFVRAIMILFRRYHLVSAAVEIESQQPEFDQRLITIASQPQASAMLSQLNLEVETIATRHAARVPLRPLLAPALALLAAALLTAAMHLNLLDLLTRLISRSGK